MKFHDLTPELQVQARQWLNNRLQMELERSHPPEVTFEEHPSAWNPELLPLPQQSAVLLLLEHLKDQLAPALLQRLRG